jgi:hypothetical protein
VLPEQLDCLTSIRRLGDQLEVAIGTDERGQATAVDRMVVHGQDSDPQARTARRVKPM